MKIGILNDVGNVAKILAGLSTVSKVTVEGSELIITTDDIKSIIEHLEKYKLHLIDNGGAYMIASQINEGLAQDAANAGADAANAGAEAASAAANAGIRAQKRKYGIDKAGEMLSAKDKALDRKFGRREVESGSKIEARRKVGLRPNEKLDDKAKEQLAEKEAEQAAKEGETGSKMQDLLHGIAAAFKKDPAFVKKPEFIKFVEANPEIKDAIAQVITPTGQKQAPTSGPKKDKIVMDLPPGFIKKT